MSEGSIASTNGGPTTEDTELTELKGSSNDRNPLIKNRTKSTRSSAEMPNVWELADTKPFDAFDAYYTTPRAPSQTLKRHWTRDERNRRLRCQAIIILLVIVGLLLFGGLADAGFIFPKDEHLPLITSLGPLMDRLPSQFALYFRAQTYDGQAYSGRALVQNHNIQLLYATTVMQNKVLAVVTDNGTTEAQTFYLRAHDKEEPAESSQRLPIAWLPEKPSTHWNLWDTLAALPLIHPPPTPATRNVTASCPKDGEQQWVTGPDGVDVWYICFGRYKEPRFVTGRRLFIEFHVYDDLAPDGPDYAVIHRIDHPGWVWNTADLAPEWPASLDHDNSSSAAAIWKRLQTANDELLLLQVAWSSPNRLAHLIANATSVAPASAGQKLLFGLHPRPVVPWVPHETRPLDHGALCMFVPGAGVRGTVQSGATAQFAHFAYGHPRPPMPASPTEPWHTYWGDWIWEPFEDERGRRYGCAETWVFVGDDEDRAFDDPELVAHICGQANDLYQRSNKKQPLALFAHGSGGLTLLQGVQDGRCRSELTWFAASVPAGTDSMAQVLQWLCQTSADGTLVTWPFGEFNIRRLTGTCKQLHQGTFAARALNLSWPGLASLARRHVRGALCGQSGTGRARAVDTPGSFALGLLEQIRRLGFLSSSSMQEGDGLLSIDSCKGDVDDELWQAVPESAFYLGELNYLDTTCAHGDSPTLATAQPCAWYRHRIRSVFNLTET